MQALVFRMGLLLAMAGSFSPLGAAGTTAASFLDIPTGAEPTALGSAYSALARNAYAPVWNPGALGFLEGTHVAGQHLSYLESIHYEYLGAAHPLAGGKWGIAAAGQYLGSGDIDQTQLNGDPAGSFSSFYTAASLSAGRRFGERWAAGLSAKWIHGAIKDVRADAGAIDLGMMLRLPQRVDLAAVLANLGSDLRFREQKDPLPLAFRGGLAWRIRSNWNVSAEGVWRKAGPLSAHAGAAWRPFRVFELRAGYRTDTLKELSALAGLSAGAGILVAGQEFSYAWRPLAELGQTHYFSLHLHFGARGQERRNLIHYGPSPKTSAAEGKP